MGESKLNNVKEEAEKIDCTSPHIADDSIQRMKQATTADTTLQTLMSVIQAGWPESKPDVPLTVREY